tara:strand:- start:33472 stop:33636 length:165 start_codon:yes stop_codon:yes gene_type:complete
LKNCCLVNNASAIVKGIKNIAINNTTGLSLKNPISKKSFAGVIKVNRKRRIAAK